VVGSKEKRGGGEKTQNNAVQGEEADLWKTKREREDKTKRGTWSQIQQSRKSEKEGRGGKERIKLYRDGEGKRRERGERTGEKIHPRSFTPGKGNLVS